MTEPTVQSHGPFARAVKDPVTYFTFALVIVGVLQWRVLDKTDSTLRLQQRAWISPIGVNLLKPLEPGRSILFSILYSNTGREPALNASLTLQSDTIESYDAQTTNLNDVSVPENTSCQRQANFEILVPPLSGGATTMNSGLAVPQYLAEKRVISNDRFYVVQGCWKYKASDELKTTTFCYIMQPVSKDDTLAMPFAVIPGPIGPVAAPSTGTAKTPAKPDDATARYQFVPCRSGFGES